MWARNALLVIWLAISLGLAVTGSLLGGIIALCVVAWEAYTAVTFVRAVILAGDTWIASRAPLGRLRSFPRVGISRVVIGRPIMGVVGRPPRIVFESPDGAALIAIDPAIWRALDIERVAYNLDIPVEEWPEPPTRSLAGHVLRFTAAAVALAITIGAAVTTAVVLLSR